MVACAELHNNLVAPLTSSASAGVEANNSKAAIEYKFSRFMISVLQRLNRTRYSEALVRLYNADADTSIGLWSYIGEIRNPVRRIGYQDPENGKHYVFTTNQYTWLSKMIAAIYKPRWQTEIFFKSIKQYLKIKEFLGISDNAVMTQIMIAFCIYLLLAYLKFQSRISINLQKICRLILLTCLSGVRCRHCCSSLAYRYNHFHSKTWRWSDIRWDSNGSNSIETP